MKNKAIFGLRLGLRSQIALIGLKSVQLSLIESADWWYTVLPGWIG